MRDGYRDVMDGERGGWLTYKYFVFLLVDGPAPHGF